MYILRTLGCLAIILGFSQANICGTVGGIFEEFDILSDDTAKEIDEGCSVVAEKIVKTGKAIKTFYDHHKKLILAGELILLAGTGLGEAGLLEEMVELYESGGVNALIEGAGEMTTEAASGIRNVANNMFEALKAVKNLPLPSLETAGTLGEETMKLIGPHLEKLMSDYILEQYPLTSAQLAILLANLIGSSDSKINTPEVACKTESLLHEYRKRSVNARLNKLEAPEEFGAAVDFYTDVRAINSKEVCTSWRACYKDYAGMIRNKTESAFPEEVFKEVCKNAKAQDEIDEKSVGYWMVTLNRIIIGYHWWKVRPSIYVTVDGKGSNHPTFESSDSVQISKGVYDINKNYEYGPFKKKEPTIEIRVRYGRVSNNDELPEFEMRGNIYDLWKNGYDPKDPENYVDVTFSWRNEPKPEPKPTRG